MALLILVLTCISLMPLLSSNFMPLKLADNAENFVEQTRENYVDLQLRIEANSASLVNVQVSLTYL